MDETVTVKLSGKYAGQEAVLDADPEARDLADLDSQSIARILAGLARLLVSWTCVDKQGQALPATAEGLARLPARALAQIIQEYGRSFRELPNR